MLPDIILQFIVCLHSVCLPVSLFYLLRALPMMSQQINKRIGKFIWVSQRFLNGSWNWNALLATSSPFFFTSDFIICWSVLSSQIQSHFFSHLVCLFFSVSLSHFQVTNYKRGTLRFWRQETWEEHVQHCTRLLNDIKKNF